MFYLYAAIVFLSFIASMSVYFRNDLPRYLKSFPLYLFFTFVHSIASYYLQLIYGNNHVVNNIHTSIAAFFYLILLSRMVVHLRARKLILSTGYVFLFVALITYLSQGILVFNTRLFSLGSLLVAIVSGYYFYELLKSDSIRKLTRDPGFWICCGTLFFYGSTLPIFGAIEFAYGFPQYILDLMAIALYVINDIFYSTLAIAFICNWRYRKSNFG